MLQYRNIMMKYVGSTGRTGKEGSKSTKIKEIYF